MTVPFDVGYVNRLPVAEWDGSNEQDILNWLNAGYGSGFITISAQTATELTFQMSNSATVTVPLNGWVSRTTPGGLGGFFAATVYLLDKDQFWASDQYGRPTTASDIESV